MVWRGGAAVVVACGLAACGRAHFDPLADAAVPADAAPNADADPLSALDDPFDGTSLDPSWSVLNGNELTTFTETGGQLVMEQTGPIGYWYGSGQGPFVYKQVAGNVAMTASVTMVGAANQTAPPPAPTWAIGGIMGRQETPIENWVWIGIGTPNGMGTIGGEHKTTVASTTIVTVFPWASTTALIRFCRVGTHVFVLDNAGTGWTLEHDYDRPDLAPALQLGMIAGVYSGPADLRVTFDSITFRTPASPADCMLP
ncbi:MAG TPA: hypothetical protein VL326_26065 [Kofleriaceae bacterium]|nr:hypothetical protein [Kofleriaceae bacterium]